MKTTSVISATTLLAWMFVGLASRAQEPVAPAADGNDAVAASAEPLVSSNSKVRIVRLSEVKGEVQLDRLTGKGFEGAMANLPVTEGARLKTGDGVAEVEFEDNSTLRVAQNSLVEFPRLEMLPSGAKTSSVNLLQGSVYVNLLNTKGNEFSVKFGLQTVNLPPDSHIRLQLTPTEANLAVMHGEVAVEESSGTTIVGKNKTATFSAGQSEPMIAKSVVEQPLDSWDHDAVQYHKSYANATSFGNSPYSYGINDMNYYGSFSNAGGCGSMWRPYFTSASWDPFGNGAFAYYPSAGYSWVSPYPWGWTPYHYGSWSYCQGTGWGWQPGGAWMGLANYNSPGGFNHPLKPSHAPSSAEPTLVQVNHQPLAPSGLKGSDTFVFRKDSAGLGVPRGSLGKLNSFSGEAVQHGMATTSVYSGARGAGDGEHGNSENPSAAISASPRGSNSSSIGSMPSASAPSGSRGPAGAPSGGGHH